MADFPTEFALTIQPIETSIGERGDAALARLREKGFEVATGLTAYFAGAVGVMGYQEHIREYCPKDATEARFATQKSTADWLRKGPEGRAGRAMFLLLRMLDKKDELMGHQLEGYGWTGIEPCDALPFHPVTSAYRLGERVKGQGLSRDFIQTVVSGTVAFYAPEGGIGLETWNSNKRAVRSYEKAGFTLRAADKQEMRPTLDSAAKNGEVEDYRLYMAYSDELLER